MLLWYAKSTLNHINQVGLLRFSPSCCLAWSLARSLDCLAYLRYMSSGCMVYGIHLMLLLFIVCLNSFIVIIFSFSLLLSFLFSSFLFSFHFLFFVISVCLCASIKSVTIFKYTVDTASVSLRKKCGWLPDCMCFENKATNMIIWVCC